METICNQRDSSIYSFTLRIWLCTGPFFGSFVLLCVFPVGAVEDMAAERVAFREIGVVEVFGGVVGHPEFFHDAAGALVLGDGEGDEAGKIEGVEGVVEDGARAFGG